MTLKIDHEITVKIVHADQNELIKLLKELKILNIENMAKTKQEFKDLKADIQVSLLNIAADIDRLVAQGQRTDLTEADEEEVFSDFSDLAGQLRTIAGKVPEEETPPVDPNPEV